MPAAIYDNPETIVFVPELQRLSILIAIFGVIPSISQIIAEEYCSAEHDENKTASISSLGRLEFFRISIQG